MDEKPDVQRIPRHIAVIMDGNGRWAKKRGMIRTFGHKTAMKSVKTAISYCSRLGVEVLTLYAFSTENWKRPQDEVSFLMDLIVEYLRKETPEMKENGVRLHFIGDVERLPEKSIQAIRNSTFETQDNHGLKVNIAINYGGRAEIVRGIRQLIRDVQSGKVTEDEITEERFSSYLYTSGDPDPDLIIRSGGETRLSNFLIWQASYAELYFTDVLWPDFGEKQFDQAIEYYQKKNRRFGGL
jgi:undecaprenyl diphosphate synthase